MQKVYIFGNADWAPDALPLKILPELEKCLPECAFITQDPNEDFDYDCAQTRGEKRTGTESAKLNQQDNLVIIDTVQGINQITTFTSLDQFTNTPRLTMHDFDLGMKLKWLAKIDKLPPLLLIGVPMSANENEVIEKITVILKKKMSGNQPDSLG